MKLFSIFTPDVFYRLPFYIAFGLVSEVIFTGLADLIAPKFLKSWNVFGREAVSLSPSWRWQGRDPRAVGYTFLWMVPIYGLLVFLEPLSTWLSGFPWILRGLFYVLILWLVEYSAGWLVKKISGRCPWDYSGARFNLHGFIRWDFFLFWFGFMLAAEWWSKKLILLTPALKEIF